MQSVPETQNPVDMSLAEICEYMSEGIAIFDAEATLRLANSSFHQKHPNLSDVLKPGIPWSIFLREAVNRGTMPLPVSQRLDALEAELATAGTRSDAVQMPGVQGRTATLRLGQTSDGGFVLTHTENPPPADDADAVRDAEILLRKVLEACPRSLIMSRVTDGRIIYRSPAATDLLGSAKSSFSHFTHREERADFITLLLPDAIVDNMRVTFRRADQTEFPAEISARLIDYRGEDVIVATVEDLTQELAIKAEMDRQKEQLFQSEKLSALGELLAAVAHELNNPLSIIVGNAEILHEEIADDGLKRRVGKLSQAAHRCVRIIRSFLSLARQEPLDLRPTELSKLIENALEAASNDTEAAKIKMHTAPYTNEPLVIADEVQLTQVIINLLSNAIQAMRDAGIGDQITIERSWNDRSLTIRVTDNGPGISDDIKTRIFDPLFTTKDAGKGTGVGLAYCHRIIAAHKGQIRLEHTARRGATFSVELPLA
ncbi:PAS domain-containing sensor histidine kinase [uncultured Roseovarius sp.]|uniref:sensor histidine kinase n=1 Tax=uncultured Roseovarius sp. TaxID=293344 RepID=UPI0026379852|nr:PAS domain-containing sensor histidine kinase [uncultured Roseovarius sp.]